MDTDKTIIKVDAYDYFGYLIPGFILLTSIIFLHLGLNGTDIEKYKSEVKTFYLSDIKTYSFITITALALIASYVLGHIIASLASFFYEKIIIKNIFGYPYKILILNAEISEKQLKTKRYFQTITVTIYAILFLFILFPQNTIELIQKQWIALSLLTLAFIFLKEAPGWTFTALTYLPVWVFTGIEKIARLFVGQDQPLPEQTRNKIDRNFQAYFDTTMENVESEVFWAIYWKITQQDSYVRSKIDKWLVLYSFMRNLGCSLLLSAVIISIPRIHGPDFFLTKLHAIILFILSIIMIIRFYYLYYGYYSKSIFRTFAYLLDGTSNNNAE